MTPKEKLDQLVQESGLVIQSQNLIKDKFGSFLQQIAGWKIKADALIVTNVSQVKEMKEAREARLALKNLRVAADKERKLMKEEGLRYNNAVQDVYNIVEAAIVPIEQHLEKQEKFAEVQRNLEIVRLQAEREKEVIPYLEFIPCNLALGAMSVSDYSKILAGAQLQLAEKQKAEKIAEEIRVKEQKVIQLHNQRKESILHLWNYVGDIKEFGNMSEKEWKEFSKRTLDAKIKDDEKKEALRLENEMLLAAREADFIKAREASKKATEELRISNEAKAKAEKEKRDAEFLLASTQAKLKTEQTLKDTITEQKFAADKEITGLKSQLKEQDFDFYSPAPKPYPLNTDTEKLMRLAADISAISIPDMQKEPGKAVLVKAQEALRKTVEFIIRNATNI